jgi:hypothetical protein
MLIGPLLDLPTDHGLTTSDYYYYYYYYFVANFHHFTKNILKKRIVCCKFPCLKKTLAKKWKKKLKIFATIAYNNMKGYLRFYTFLLNITKFG